MRVSPPSRAGRFHGVECRLRKLSPASSILVAVAAIRFLYKVMLIPTEAATFNEMMSPLITR